MIKIAIDSISTYPIFVVVNYKNKLNIKHRKNTKPRFSSMNFSLIFHYDFSLLSSELLRKYLQQDSVSI